MTRPPWFPLACDLYLQGYHCHTIACRLWALDLAGPRTDGRAVRQALDRDALEAATVPSSH